MIYYVIYIAEIGTQSVYEGGGRHHPIKNEGGAGKIVPLHFWTVLSSMDLKKSKNLFEQRNPTELHTILHYKHD